MTLTPQQTTAGVRHLKEQMQLSPNLTLYQPPAGQRRARTLPGFERKICDCRECPLGGTRQNFVFGVGSPTARIMFVGEAPGAREDELGEPFVGRAGELLDRMLGAIQLQREDVYIANILKCRPPGNRDPLPEESEQCLPYLLEQIRLIRPWLICCLGRIAAQILMDTKMSLSKMRGRFHDFHGTPLLATFHPAALLRNPNFKKDSWDDLRLLRSEHDRRAGIRPTV